MTALVHAELQRLLARRATWALLLACVLVSAAASWAFSQIVLQVAADGAPVSPTEAAVFVVTRSSLAPAAAAVLAAGLVGGELRHRTIEESLLITPRRGRLLVAKALALTVLAGALALLGSSLVYGVAWLTLGPAQVALPAATALAVALPHSGFTVGAALLGGAAALLLRAQVPAVVLTAVYPLLVEPAVRGAVGVAGSPVLSDLARFLPWAAGSSMQQVARPAGGTALLADASATLSPVLAAVLFTASVLCLSGCAAWSFVRRDALR